MRKKGTDRLSSEAGSSSSASANDCTHKILKEEDDC